MQIHNKLGPIGLLVAAWAWPAGAAAQSLATQGRFEVVAITDQEAPIDGGGVFLSGFFGPVLSVGGESTFFATIHGAGVTSADNHTIMTSENGSLRLVARSGQQAPGTDPGVVFPSFSNVQYNNAQGEAGFTSSLAGPGVTSANDRGIWSEGGGGGLTLVAREGGQVVGYDPGVVFFGTPFGIQGLADSGDSGFISRIAGPGVDQFNDHALWTFDASTGQPRAAVREGDQAPGFPVGSTFGVSSVGSTPFSSEVFAPSGRWAVLADVSTSAGNSGGVFYEDSSGDLQLLFREEQAAPQTEPDSVFDRFRRVDMNASSELAVLAGVDGPAVNSANRNGVWAFRDGNATLVARDGQMAPGLSGVVLALSLLDSPVINAGGQVALLTRLAGAGVTSLNDTAILAEDALGVTRLAAREGDVAPGTLGVATFQELQAFAFNAAGQVAFHAGLLGAGVDGTNNAGVWMELSPGNLALVIREGDVLEVAPGDFRTVQFVDFLSETVREPGGFNDSGKLSMLVNFTDGTSAIMTVPEPSSLMLAGIAACALLWTTRKAKGGRMKRRR